MPQPDQCRLAGLPLRLRLQPDARPAHGHAGADRPHLRDLLRSASLDDGNPIVTRAHCYACTAGQGSSCGGALDNH
ncbi:DUF3641 domain-containing protein [Azotobacter chroococcum]|uniref:DUF3641 domain-containing protein n=1 Tax=Azotobacter chroococcum TaxID=353 RepID=UPI0024183DEF|nr:DUF3641 domain-containing protein [Azotobacter chroococcum]